MKIFVDFYFIVNQNEFNSTNNKFNIYFQHIIKYSIGNVKRQLASIEID